MFWIIRLLVCRFWVAVGFCFMLFVFMIDVLFYWCFVVCLISVRLIWFCLVLVYVVWMDLLICVAGLVWVLIWFSYWLFALFICFVSMSWVVMFVLFDDTWVPIFVLDLDCLLNDFGVLFDFWFCGSVDVSLLWVAYLFVFVCVFGVFGCLFVFD